jgi:hypothetical protein
VPGVTTPTPAPSRPPTVSFDAKLLPAEQLVDENLLAPLATSWTVTFGLGGPAAGTYTEVRFPAAVLDAEGGAREFVAGAADPAYELERLLDDLVRRVAEETYGRSWAFHYRPEQYEQSVARWNTRRREVVVVERLEVYP